MNKPNPMKKLFEENARDLNKLKPWQRTNKVPFAYRQYVPIKPATPPSNQRAK